MTERPVYDPDDEPDDRETDASVWAYVLGGIVLAGMAVIRRLRGRR